MCWSLLDFLKVLFLKVRLIHFLCLWWSQLTFYLDGRIILPVLTDIIERRSLHFTSKKMGRAVFAKTRNVAVAQATPLKTKQKNCVTYGHHWCRCTGAIKEKQDELNKWSIMIIISSGCFGRLPSRAGWVLTVLRADGWWTRIEARCEKREDYGMQIGWLCLSSWQNVLLVHTELTMNRSKHLLSTAHFCADCFNSNTEGPKTWICIGGHHICNKLNLWSVKIRLDLYFCPEI